MTDKKHLKPEEKKVLAIVEKNPGLYTTQIAQRFDEWDYKHGHQNRTRKILKKQLEDKWGLIWSQKLGRCRYWYAK